MKLQWRLTFLFIVLISKTVFAASLCSAVHLNQITQFPPSFLQSFLPSSREQEIRATIQARGLTVVVENAADLRDEKSGPHPQIITAENLPFYERLFGVPVKVVDPTKTGPAEKISGVVLHLGRTEELLKFYRGDVNLTHPLKETDRFRRVFDDKWQEYVLARSIDPEAMPVSRNLTEIIKRDRGVEEQFEQLREKTIASLQQSLQKSNGSLADLEGRVRELVRFSFGLFRQEFSAGAFVKYIREASTGDFGGPINTGIQEEKVVQDFMQRMKQILSGTSSPLPEYGTAEFEELILGASWGASDNTKVNLINALLENPGDLMVQEKLDIQKTSDQKMLEIRVNFIRGRSFSAHTRWSFDYLPDHLRAAEKFLNDFFAKAPSQLQALSGGADIVFLKDGSIKFIEFNFGAESGYMDVRGCPIEANEFMSNLIGKQTPLIRELESVVRAGVAAEIAFLNSKKIMNHEYKIQDQTIDDQIYIDSFQYFRDRALEEQPSHHRQQILNDLNLILESQRPRLEKSRQDIIEKWEAIILATQNTLSREN